MARIHQNKDIALLFGVFRSLRRLVRLMTSSRESSRDTAATEKKLYFLSNMNIIEF